MKVVFTGVEVTIHAETPEDAYRVLSDLMSDNGISWCSDKFTTDEDGHEEQRDTLDIS